ncbi:hypothetical protein [Polaromonas glacialis]|uniref:hypothetical protein n=1 Tax=Polaromonas glacialis TaxID=866564 RepID=UPI0012EC4064|nr:hypothetical protein [Polaromonas glacialis]
MGILMVRITCFFQAFSLYTHTLWAWSAMFSRAQGSRESAFGGAAFSLLCILATGLNAALAASLMPCPMDQASGAPDD